MIRIAITPCLMGADPSRGVFGPKSLSYIENDMADYVVQTGVLPIFIPFLSDAKLESILDEVDAVVLQGGVDLHPESYGEEHLNLENWTGDLLRDRYEMKILDYAFSNKIPTLGICRGCQMINCYFGGTLLQDITSLRSDALSHRCSERYDTVCHPVDFLKEGFFPKIYSSDSGMVNSVHHQGLDRIGEKLKVQATSSEDGIVEAVSFGDPKIPLMLGVQWHPEFSHTLGDKVLDPKPIIDFLIDQARMRLK